MQAHKNPDKPIQNPSNSMKPGRTQSKRSRTHWNPVQPGKTHGKKPFSTH